MSGVKTSGKPMRRRSVGIPWPRWEDNFIMVLREREVKLVQFRIGLLDCPCEFWVP